MINAYLNFISSSFPSKKITNNQISKLNPEWNSKSIFNKLGIKNRYVLDDNESTIDLIIKALKLFFKSNKILNPQDVDAVILCTQTSEVSIPTNSCIVQHIFKMRKDILTFDYNLGCSGYTYGLSIAKGLILTGDVSNVILITAEAYSKRIHKNDFKNRSLFGDGATVSLISKNKYSDTHNFKIGNFSFGTDGSGFGDLFYSTEKSKNILKKYSINYQKPVFDNCLHMNGQNIFNFTLSQIPNLISRNLSLNNYDSINDIQYFIFHQANSFMLNAIRRRCKISRKNFIIDMKNTGNTVSSTIPVAFQNKFYNGNTVNLNKNQNIMLVGFGVGLSMASCIVNYENC